MNTIMHGDFFLNNLLQSVQLHAYGTNNILFMTRYKASHIYTHIYIYIYIYIYIHGHRTTREDILMGGTQYMGGAQHMGGTQYMGGAQHVGGYSASPVTLCDAVWGNSVQKPS